MIDLFKSMSISGSALAAERLRMDVTAGNLANANTPGYKRREVVLAPSFSEQLATARGGASGTGGQVPDGVRAAAIVEDTAPDRQVYDPTNPAADAAGYVAMPNVDTVTEMVDLISAQRAYEANVTAMQTAKQLYAKTLDLLR
jgi:flagellar basal-body rod protein FlgC